MIRNWPIFLFTYEYKYICNLIETGSTDLKRFKYIYRYIDDLITLCDHGYFDRIFKDIYPPELELKPTSISTSEANYLDMNIKVADDHSHFFTHKLYDKRNDFDFKVISMPNIASNIPFKQTHGVFYSQIIRIFNANNNWGNFKLDLKLLVDKLCRQNFKRSNLVHEVAEFRRHFNYEITSQYWENITSVSAIFD